MSSEPEATLIEGNNILYIKNPYTPFFQILSEDPITAAAKEAGVAVSLHFKDQQQVPGVEKAIRDSYKGDSLDKDTLTGKLNVEVKSLVDKIFNAAIQGQKLAESQKSRPRQSETNEILIIENKKNGNIFTNINFIKEQQQLGVLSQEIVGTALKSIQG